MAPLGSSMPPELHDHAAISGPVQAPPLYYLLMSMKPVEVVALSNCLVLTAAFHLVLIDRLGDKKYLLQSLCSLKLRYMSMDLITRHN